MLSRQDQDILKYPLLNKIICIRLQNVFNHLLGTACKAFVCFLSLKVGAKVESDEKGKMSCGLHSNTFRTSMILFDPFFGIKKKNTHNNQTAII